MLLKKIKNGEIFREYMERIIFDSYEELAIELLSNAGEEINVCAVMFYDGARKLLKELLMFENVQISDIDLSSIEQSGYAKEYIISVENRSVSVSPAWADKCHTSFQDEPLPAGYFTIDEFQFVYLDGDVNSKILKSIKGAICKEFEVDDNGYFEEENCMQGCDFCDIIENYLNQ